MTLTTTILTETIPPASPPPSGERAEAGSIPLKSATLPEAAVAANVDAVQVATAWVDGFNQALAQPDATTVGSLFADSGYWRDHLCLTWDLRCLEGPEKIAPVLAAGSIKSLTLDLSTPFKVPQVAQVDGTGRLNVVQAFLNVATQVGRGRGVLRLIPSADTWKAYTLFTTLEELNGFEEPTGKRRPNGVAHGTLRGRLNWKDHRDIEHSFADDAEPTVLIVGAGQAGLAMAARLKMLGMKSLIVDKNKRVGDNWRSRYHSLVLHDAVWMDHLPYLPFPEHWPVFTPKDKLGDWFEMYAQALELNVWMESSITASSWDDSTAQWTVTVESTADGKTATRTFHPKHIIQATGHSGKPNFPSHITGIDGFKGERLCHSAEFFGAKPNGQGKKAVVVGCCSSGHDIAQDFFEKGYDVTMVQRSTTFVVSAEAHLSTVIDLYGENGPPVEDADIFFQSFPNEVLKTLNIEKTVQTTKMDEQLLIGLQKAGFKLDFGPANSGLWIKYLQLGGGYYIDVGCSQLVADGKIKVKQGVEIDSVQPHGLKFADGTVLEADEIIFATGYKNMRTQSRIIFGDEVADRVGDVWGFDGEGEMRMWRRSGHPGFWFMGGNFVLCRYFSRIMALQMKGLEEGLFKY